MMAKNAPLLRIERARQIQQSVTLLAAGFRSSIVTRHTGLRDRQVRELQRSMSGESSSKRCPGVLPEACGILNNRRRLIEGGLFILLYQRYGGDVVERAIVIEAIIKAHPLYLELHDQIYPHDARWHLALDINQSWVLARDLCAGRLRLEKCRHRHCGHYYIWVQNQRIRAGCPLCSLRAASAPRAGFERPQADNVHVLCG